MGASEDIVLTGENEICCRTEWDVRVVSDDAHAGDVRSDCFVEESENLFTQASRPATFIYNE